MNFPRIRGRWPAVRHHLFLRGLSGLAPYFLINEFPKSGGTWLAQMVADGLGAPFRRNMPVRLERSVSHGHFLSPVGLRHVTVLWRDPRDMLVSYYYHCYFLNDHHNRGLVTLMKRRCPFDDYNDIRGNLPTFIKFLTRTPVSPGFSWPEFARIWTGRAGTVQTSYEALRANTSGELARVVKELTGVVLSGEQATAVAERYSFARAKKAAELARPSHAETSFVRVGALGEWREHFSPEGIAALEECGYVKRMEQLGYAFY